MDQLQILLIEDNLSFALEVEILLSESGYKLLESVNNAADALKVLETKTPDLILLDIGIKGPINGLEFAEEIIDRDIPTIFITQSRDDDTYNRAQKTKPIAYLVKPFDLLTLQGTIENVVRLNADQEHSKSNLIIPQKIAKKGVFFVKKNNNLSKLKATQIDWVESDGNYCMINSGEKKYVIKISLSALLKRLEPFNFIRIHKSYIIPIDKIENIDLFESMVYTSCRSFPLGRSYKTELVKRLDLL